jgi:spermidine synthase
LTAPVEAFLFVSGFSALVLEVVYVKLLRYWVGNTAYAVAAVLCAYMLGLAAGSFLAGRWLIRFPRLLAVYGSMELLIGLYSAGLPWSMNGLKPFYLGLTALVGPDSRLAVVGHFTASVVVLLFPTLMMGATYPVVTRAASHARRDSPEVAERLYYANLAGAALGALLSDFLLIRFWGLGNTLFMVATINTLLALWVFRWQGRGGVATDPPVEGAAPSASPRSSMVMLSVAFLGGFLVLFLEMVWTSMVGRFLDNTVYAFAVILFAVIAGLAAGARIVHRLMARRAPTALLPACCLGTGVLVMALLPFWDWSRVLAGSYSVWCAAGAAFLLWGVVLTVDPRVKASLWYVLVAGGVMAAILYRHHADPQGSAFWVLHGTDFCVCVLFMVAPAVLMGTVFPAVLRWHLSESGSESPSVARVYAVNTLGCLAGVLTATFVLLPRFGVERCGRWVGLGFFLLGVALALRAYRPRWRWVMALALVVCAGWLQVAPRWDFSRTLRYLGYDGTFVYQQEDVNAGITTVLHANEWWEIFANELFNGGTNVEEKDQARVALVPMLYVRKFERALVIGIGTGEAAGLIGEYPFRHIEIVDLSPRVVEAADQNFGMLNFGILTNPRASVHVDDGRHYLFTHPDHLSLLTIEVSRLWTSGEGDLYTREFYEICSARLQRDGILQQWVPLFSLSIPDTLIILRTARQVFPYVALFVGGGSGVFVASHSPLKLDFARFQALDQDPRISAVLKRIDLDSAGSLLGDLVLRPDGVDAVLARYPERRVSTDLFPYLEYANARYHVGLRSVIPLWQFLLSAEDFTVPPVIGASPLEMAAIEKAAVRERQAQFDNLSQQ